MKGVELIKEIPEFQPEVDSLLLAEFGEKHPQIAHVLSRVSTETAYRKWVVERLCELNNSHVRNSEEWEETKKILGQLAASMKTMADQLADVKQKSDASAKTILDWTIKFKSPLTLLGALLGIILTAGVGALVQWLVSGPNK